MVSRASSITSEAIGARFAVDSTAARDPLPVLIWVLIASYLLIDMFSGMMMQGASVQAPLSQAWKTLILLLILLWSMTATPLLFGLVLGLLSWMLLAPTVRLLMVGDVQDFIADAIGALKALMPMLVLGFCQLERERDEARLRRWAGRALWFSSFVVLLNVLLGLLGFGYSTYEQSGDDSVGVKGFFFAGNEVGATFTVLAGFVLAKTWEKRRWLYPFTAAVFCLAGVAIATKSTIIAALILAIAVPVVATRGRIFLTVPGFISAIAVSAVLVWAAIRIRALLELTGLADRIAYILTHQGWLGLLLSSRDQFAAATLEAVSERGSALDAVIGVGRATLLRWSGAESTEMDPLDLYLWFGAPGAIYIIVLYAMFLYLSVRAFLRNTNPLAGPVLLTNVLVILISVVSGHVVLGSMAGIAWAVVNGLAATSESAPSARRR